MHTYESRFKLGDTVFDKEGVYSGRVISIQFYEDGQVHLRRDSGVLICNETPDYPHPTKREALLAKAERLDAEAKELREAAETSDDPFGEVGNADYEVTDK